MCLLLLQIEFNIRVSISCCWEVLELHDNRILYSIFKYWHARIQGGHLPARAQIFPAQIPNLLPFLFLADVNNEGSIRLRLIGTHIERLLGCDLTGCALDARDSFHSAFGVQRDFYDAATQQLAIGSTHELYYDTTLETGIHDQRPAGNIEPIMLRYDRLILPLSRDGERVDMLFGGLVAVHPRQSVPHLDAEPIVFTEVKRSCLPPPYIWPQQEGVWQGGLSQSRAALS